MLFVLFLYACVIILGHTPQAREPEFSRGRAAPPAAKATPRSECASADAPGGKHIKIRYETLTCTSKRHTYLYITLKDLMVKYTLCTKAHMERRAKHEENVKRYEESYQTHHTNIGTKIQKTRAE